MTRTSALPLKCPRCDSDRLHLSIRPESISLNDQYCLYCARCGAAAKASVALFHKLTIGGTAKVTRMLFDKLTEAGRGDADMAPPKVARRPTIPLDATVVTPSPKEEEAHLPELEELESVEITEGETVTVAAATKTLDPKITAAIAELSVEVPAPVKKPPVKRTAKAEAGGLEVVTEPPPAAPPTVSVSVTGDEIKGLANEIDGAGMERDWRHRWIFYGFNKVGKTRTQDDPNTLIVNTEDGTISIADKPIDQRALQIQVRSKRKLEQVYWMLKTCKPHESGRGLIVPTKLGPRHVDTIAFDTVTRLIFWALREEVLGPTHAPDLTKPMPDISLPMRGKAYNWVTQWLILFRDLPVHTVYLCQQREPNEKDATPETVVGLPDMPPSVRNVIQGDVDVIGRVFVKADEDGEAGARIQFGPTEEYITGDRFFVLPKIVKHTTFRKLLGYVEKKRAERSAASA